MATNRQTRTPEEIEAELDQSRARMGDTLEALQRRLSPGDLWDQTLGYVRESGGGEFAENFKQGIGQNPVPVSLVGAGLAWLMMFGRGGDHHADAFEMGKQGATRIGDMASGARGKTKDAAHQARAGLGRVASGGRDRMQQLSHGASAGASRVGALSREGSARAKSGFDYLVNEQPLMLGAIGIALGAALAASLPRSRQEDELMGDARNEFLESARAKGEQQANKARQVVKSARDAAREQAEREGLTTETANQKLHEGQAKAKRVADAASAAAKDEANRQGIGTGGDTAHP